MVRGVAPAGDADFGFRSDLQQQHGCVGPPHDDLLACAACSHVHVRVASGAEVG